MAYRAPDEDRVLEDQRRAAARAAVRQLAADGEADAEAAESARAAQASEASRRQARAAVRRFCQSCLSGARWHMPMILSSVFGLCGAGGLLMAFGGGSTASIAGGVALIILGATLPIAVVELMRGRVVAGERARVAALPYRVDGYEHVLSEEPRSGTLALTLHFVGEAPDEPTLAGLAGKLGGRAEPRGDRKAVITSGELSADGGDGPETNARFYAWLRAALDDVLAPLHLAYPLARVEIRR